MSTQRLYPLTRRIKSAFAVLIALVLPLIAICIALSLLRSAGLEFDPDSFWSDVADFGDAIVRWQIRDYLEDRIGRFWGL